MKPCDFCGRRIAPDNIGHAGGCGRATLPEAAPVEPDDAAPDTPPTGALTTPHREG